MKKVLRVLSICLMSLLTFLPTALAAEEAALAVDTGDTAFVLMSAALVMLMTPGLALFYGGMVRTKNVLNTIMMSFFIVGLISVQWVLWGYTLAFGNDIGSLVGDFTFLGLNGVGQAPNPDFSETIPHMAFMAFQGMFAVITAALITGAFAERMKFPAFIVFTLAWATFVYDPVAHWVWGGGWLGQMGVLDFAGGTVVHIISGVSGLVIAIMIGKRKDYGKKAIIPHNLPMVVIGASLLWFGWFGFNAGSALSANGLAASAFVTTNVAAAAATVSWVFVEWMYNGKPTILGAASGCIAGLVAITPAAGFVTPMAAVIMGLLGGAVCFYSVSVIKAKLGYDDALDAFGVHGVGGTFGAIATGFFATTEVNPGGADGLFYGNPEQVVIQIIGVVASWAVAIIMTFILIKIIGVFMPIRSEEQEENTGLDIIEHGEKGYAYQDLGSEFISGAAFLKTEVATQPILNVATADGDKK